MHLGDYSRAQDRSIEKRGLQMYIEPFEWVDLRS